MKDRVETGHVTKFDVIYHTRETVFHRDIETLRVLMFKIRHAVKYFLTKFGFWIADQILSRVFDITSQSKQKLSKRQRSKIVKIYAH